MQITHPIYTNYNVTNTGKVISNVTGKVLKASTTWCSGYKSVSLQIAGKHTRVKVHHLVYEAFIGTRTKGLHIHHIDGNKLNNRVSNLQEVTAKVNTREYHKTLTYNCGEVLPVGKPRNAKITIDTAKALILDIRGGMSNGEAAAKYGLHSRYISLVRHKRRWKNAWVELGLAGAETNPSGSKA